MIFYLTVASYWLKQCHTKFEYWAEHNFYNNVSSGCIVAQREDCVHHRVTSIWESRAVGYCGEGLIRC